MKEHEDGFFGTLRKIVYWGLATQKGEEYYRDGFGLFWLISFVILKYLIMEGSSVK